MKKKCPECWGSGFESPIDLCWKCNGLGEITVRYQISKIKPYRSHVTRPWKLEYPDGTIRFYESWSDAMWHMHDSAKAAA